MCLEMEYKRISSVFEMKQLPGSYCAYVLVCLV